jgi:hypothetical protein
MGWFDDIKKSVSKAVDAVTPDVTIKNPTKPIENLVQGATNLQSNITGSVIGGVGDIANQAVTATGKVLQNPAAGTVLGAAGAAFGIPGLNALASQFGSIGQPQPEPRQVIEIPGQVSGNKNLLIYGGVGFAVLLFVSVLLLNRKKR